MPKAIVLHAGFHKTGTSTVQQVLRVNRGLLKKHMAIRLKPQMKELLHATRGYSTWRDPLTLAKADRRFTALLTGLPKMPRRTLCLSAEELSGHMPGRRELCDYSAAPVLMARFARRARALFPEADISLAFTTRAPKNWLHSAWAEHVKSSSMTLDLDAFIEKYNTGAQLETIAQEAAERAGTGVLTIPMEDHAKDLARPLLRHCGVPDEVLDSRTPVDPVNTRLPLDVLLELLQANRAYADRDARKAAKQAILARMQT